MNSVLPAPSVPTPPVLPVTSQPQPSRHMLLWAIAGGILLATGIVIGIFVSRYPDIFGPPSVESVCRKGGYQSVRACGGYFIAEKPCCDQGADILDYRGISVATCDGFPKSPDSPESGCEKLLKTVDTNNCQELVCSPQDAQRIKSPYPLWEQPIIFLRQWLSRNSTSRIDSKAILEPTPTVDLTANWKTYIWEALSFSFKYPSDWTYTESTPLQSVSFNTGKPSWAKMSNGGNQVYIFEALLEEQVNFENWSKQSDYLGQETIAGATFEKYIVGDMYYSLNYIYKAGNGRIIRFMVFPYDANQYPELLRQQIDQILSTFKFLNTTEAGVLEASVIRSPTCAGPVREQEVCEGPYINSTFKIIRLSDNEVVQTVNTDKDGEFTALLAPGAYQLQNTESGIGKNIRNPDFTIADGKTVTQRFDVDTGIR